MLHMKSTKHRIVMLSGKPYARTRVLNKSLLRQSFIQICLGDVW